MVSSPEIQGVDRVREVFARVRAGDLGVAELYAEDAVLISGAGVRSVGRDGVRAFYQQAMAGMRPKPEVEAVLESPPLYVAVVNVATTEGSRRAVDLFHLDGGEIQSLEIFSRGGGGGRTDGMTRLADLEAIKQLKARYFRFTDAKDWPAFRDLFTDDCKHYLPQGSATPFMTNDQYFETMETMLANGVTTHHGHMPEITFHGDDEAEGIWSMHDYVQVQTPRGRVSLKGYGYYHETYRRCGDGQWRISSKRNERLRQDEVPWTLGREFDGPGK